MTNINYILNILLKYFYYTKKIKRDFNYENRLKCYFFILISFPYFESKARPANTRIAPSHCLELIGFPNKNTDPKMVKNLRVVVMIEQVSGPNVVIVVNIKCLSK